MTDAFPRSDQCVSFLPPSGNPPHGVVHWQAAGVTPSSSSWSPAATRTTALSELSVQAGAGVKTHGPHSETREAVCSATEPVRHALCERDPRHAGLVGSRSTPDSCHGRGESSYPIENKWRFTYPLLDVRSQARARAHAGEPSVTTVPQGDRERASGTRGAVSFDAGLLPWPR